MKTPTALDLPAVDPLPESTERYFRICQERLGMVPNVLKAHAFDIAKLNAATYIDSELAMRCMHDNYESSLPIHRAMGRFFEHRGLLQ